jgi:hypothetical protein
MNFLFNALVMRRVAIALWAVAGLLVVAIAWRLLFQQEAEQGRFAFPTLATGKVIVGPDGHAYQYIAAPRLTWDQARAAAQTHNWQGHKGYLATLGSAAEFHFVLKTVFPGEDTDVTYLGGRQTAPGEWRWVTGPDGAADGGKGTLFWQGYEAGHATEGHFGEWMFTAFQHGGKWDVGNVCCVTLFSYRKRMLSTSLGNADPDEGVAGYLVEYGE